MPMTERSRHKLYETFTALIDDETAVQEMLSYFPARDVEEPVTKEHLRAELLATRAAVSNEQARLQAEVDASRARHQRLRDVVLPAAEKAARGADVAIQKGAMSLTDYLDTQRSLRSARIEATLARAELARAGLLLRLAGDTP